MLVYYSESNFYYNALYWYAVYKKNSLILLIRLIFNNLYGSSTLYFVNIFCIVTKFNNKYSYNFRKPCNVYEENKSAREASRSDARISLTRYLFYYSR